MGLTMQPTGMPMDDLAALMFAIQNGIQPEGYTANPNSPFSRAIADYPAAQTTQANQAMQAGTQQGQPTVATPTTNANQEMQNDPAKQDDLAAILGSIRAPEQRYTPLPMTPQTEMPRSLNPAFAQMVLSQLMAQNSPTQQKTLGQIFGGQ